MTKTSNGLLLEDGGAQIVSLLGSGSSSTGTAAPQTKGASQVVVLQSAAVATGNGTVIDLSGMGAMSLIISGTFVGTITFEAQDPAGGFATIMLQQLASTTLSSTATTTGVWRGPIGGLSGFRARISAFTSGSITVTAFAENTTYDTGVQNVNEYSAYSKDIDSMAVYSKEYTVTKVTADAVISAVPAVLCGYYVESSTAALVSFYDNASAASGDTFLAKSKAVTTNDFIVLENPVNMTNGIYFDLVSGTGTLMILSRIKLAQ